MDGLTTRAAVSRRSGQPWELTDLDPLKGGEVNNPLQGSGMCHSDEYICTGYTATRMPFARGHVNEGSRNCWTAEDPRVITADQAGQWPHRPRLRADVRRRRRCRTRFWIQSGRRYDSMAAATHLPVDPGGHGVRKNPSLHHGPHRCRLRHADGRHLETVVCLERRGNHE